MSVGGVARFNARVCALKSNYNEVVARSRTKVTNIEEL